MSLQLEQELSATTDEKLRDVIVYVERYVRQVRPDAKLMFGVDRRGTVTHVGIYDAKLLLNERNQFHPIEQFAPQLLSERLEYREEWQSRSKLRLQFDAWASAYAKLTALGYINIK